MNIEQIRALCGTDHVVWSAHCLKRLQQRSIRIADVEFRPIFPFPAAWSLGLRVPDKHCMSYAPLGKDRCL